MFIFNVHSFFLGIALCCYGIIFYDLMLQFVLRARTVFTKIYFFLNTNGCYKLVLH